MYKCNRFILTCVGLLVLVMSAAGVTGCAENNDNPTPEDNQEPFIENPTPDDSHLPFISNRVVTVRITMKASDWQYIQTSAQEEKYVLADFWYDDELIEDVAVRPKGSSSLQFVDEEGSIRFSLKVDFNKFDSERTFRGLKRLNFNNGYRDPTLIRERLTYEVFDRMGVPAPRTSHVDLWVNDTHLGVYTQVEQVDKVLLRRYFSNDKGDLYKPITPASSLNWTGQRHLNTMRLRTNEESSNHQALLHFLEVLNDEPDETFPVEIEKVLDVDEVLRYFAVSTVIGYLDSYIGRGHNYYLYEAYGRFTIIPWDPNEAFGTFKCGATREEVINLDIHEPVCDEVGERPLLERLLAYEQYRDAYYKHVKTLVEGPFSFDVMDSRINEIADLIRPYAENDDLKFHDMDEFKKNLDDDVGRFLGLRTFVTERGAAISKQLAELLPVDDSS